MSTLQNLLVSIFLMISAVCFANPKDPNYSVEIILGDKYGMLGIENSWYTSQHFSAHYGVGVSESSGTVGGGIQLYTSPVACFYPLPCHHIQALIGFHPTYYFAGTKKVYDKSENDEKIERKYKIGAHSFLHGYIGARLIISKRVILGFNFGHQVKLSGQTSVEQTAGSIDKKVQENIEKELESRVSASVQIGVIF